MRHSCDLVLVGIDHTTGGPAGDHFDGHIQGLESPGELPHAIDVSMGRIPEPEDGSPFMTPEVRNRQCLIEPVEGLFERLPLRWRQVVLLNGEIKRTEQPEPPSRSGTAQSSLKADEHDELRTRYDHERKTNRRSVGQR